MACIITITLLAILLFIAVFSLSNRSTDSYTFGIHTPYNGEDRYPSSLPVSCDRQRELCNMKCLIHPKEDCANRCWQQAEYCKFQKLSEGGSGN